MKHFISGKLVAFDTETTGLRVWHGDAPFAFSFCNPEGDTAYFEWQVDPKTRVVIPKKNELRMLKDFFEDERVTKVTFNGKFDARALQRGHDITLCGPGGPVWEDGRIEEVSIAAHACNSRESSYALKPLSHKYLEITEEDQDELKACVLRMRRWAKKDGWKISYEVKEDSEGNEKKKAQVEADYWIPGTAHALGKKWAMKSREAGLCRRYAIKDAERTMLLHLMYQHAMDERDVRDTYERELELWPVVYRMEDEGATVFKDRIDKAEREAREVLVETKKRIEREFGWKGINLRSPPQVAKMLFDKCKVPLGVPRKKKGKLTNPRSTALDEISDRASHPAVSTLLRHRTVEKGIGSFLLKYRRLGLQHPTVRNALVLHGGFKSTGTDTARFSCSDPNLQQVSSPESSRHGVVMDIRAVFGPVPGDVWLASDYDGQEIRLYAEVSQEPNMMKALAEGRDIHSMIISRICGGEGNNISIKAGIRALGLDGMTDRFTPEVQLAREEMEIRSGKAYSLQDARKISSRWLRKFAWDIEKAEKSLGRKNTRGRLKQSTFGKCYGASAKTLAITLEEPIEEAKELMAVYNDEFPEMDRFMNESIRKVRKDGCIRTLWNRLLMIDPNRAYTVVNYLIQGSASDLLKHAMINLSRWFRREGIDACVLMPIHDELITRVRHAECTMKFVRQYAAVMEDNGGHLQFPIPTKPLLIEDSWSTPRKIRGYRYAS